MATNRGKRTRKANYKAKGIRRHGNRWEVTLQVQGESFSTSFPFDTELETMQGWQRRKEHAALERQRDANATPSSRGTMQADVAVYLTQVASMPTLKERTYHLGLWVAELGAARDRSTITTAEIDVVLHRWKLTGKEGQPLGNMSVRHRRAALLHLFNKLDGKVAWNPVRAAWNPRQTPPAARALPMETVQRILDHITIHGKTRARLFVLATTGLPPKQVKQITPEDVARAVQTGQLRVAGRNKGAGTAARVMPVTPEALVALQMLDAANAYGHYANSSAWLTFRRACRKAGVVGNVRPYDLKHSLGSYLYRKGRNLDSVARLLDVDPRTARRYTLAAQTEVDEATMALAAGALSVPRA
jgi:integrase